MLRAGDVWVSDHRTGTTPARAEGAPLLLATWNIERGYDLKGIIKELRDLDADVLAIQEVDIGCKRSGNVDTGLAIAKALGLNYAFFTEFEEFESPLRSERDQGGGVHGNAILTKFDILDASVLRHG